MVHLQAKYRQLLTTAKQSPPWVPFFPMVMKDITFLHDGNKSNTDGLVNFDKLRMLAHELWEHQKSTKECYRSSAMFAKKDGKVSSMKAFWQREHNLRRIRLHIEAFQPVSSAEEMQLSYRCEPSSRPSRQTIDPSKLASIMGQVKATTSDDSPSASNGSLLRAQSAPAIVTGGDASSYKDRAQAQNAGLPLRLGSQSKTQDVLVSRMPSLSESSDGATPYSIPLMMTPTDPSVDANGNTSRLSGTDRLSLVQEESETPSPSPSPHSTLASADDQLNAKLHITAKNGSGGYQQQLHENQRRFDWAAPEIDDRDVGSFTRVMQETADLNSSGVDAKRPMSSQGLLQYLDSDSAVTVTPAVVSTNRRPAGILQCGS